MNFHVVVISLKSFASAATAYGATALVYFLNKVVFERRKKTTYSNRMRFVTSDFGHVLLFEQFEPDAELCSHHIDPII